MKTYTEEDMIRFAEWFNTIQWRGGKGDPVKNMFCRCDYPAIVRQGLKELKMTDVPSDVNEEGIP